MSTDDFGFAPPPFKPEEALQRLRRDLRELGLSEREGVFERRGLAIARVRVDGAQLAAALVERPREPVLAAPRSGQQRCGARLHQRSQARVAAVGRQG